MAKTLNKKKQIKKNRLTPKEKIASGKKWDLHFDVDPAVAPKIIEEHEKSPKGTQIQYILNKALKKAYGIKSK